MVHHLLFQKSHGILPFQNPWIGECIKRGQTVTTEMEVFFKYCPSKIFAVTGSNGKTTTTTLISKMLEAEGYKVFLGGNIGKALMPCLDEITKDDIADDEPLFTEGLGLDSIDALELGMALKKKYDIQMDTDKEDNKKHFYSVSTLVDYIRGQING